MSLPDVLIRTSMLLKGKGVDYCCWGPCNTMSDSNRYSVARRFRAHEVREQFSLYLVYESLAVISASFWAIFWH